MTNAQETKNKISSIPRAVRIALKLLLAICILFISLPFAIDGIGQILQSSAWFLNHQIGHLAISSTVPSEGKWNCDNVDGPFETILSLTWTDLKGHHTAKWVMFHSLNSRLVPQFREAAALNEDACEMTNDLEWREGLRSSTGISCKTIILTSAVKRGDLPTVQKMVDAKADLNAAGTAGWTPLRLALEKGNPQIIQLLRDAGAKR